MTDVLDLASDDPESYPPIQILMLRAFRRIGPIAKKDSGQGVSYNFRGVDTVTNAVSPILRDLGILPTPDVLEERIDNYLTKNGAAMNRAICRVRWTFTGPRGDSMSATVSGESADTSDKSVTQAQSVAQRISLLSVFLIPTDAPDPDAQREERAPDVAPEPDWPDMGWANKAEHDNARAMLGKRSKRLHADDQKALKAWLGDQGWVLPYTHDQMEAWAAKTAEIEAEAETPADA